jgi:CubicO group peptidase (beta-lactamase class C family)
MAEPTAPDVAPHDAPGAPRTALVDVGGLDRLAATDRFSGVVRIDRSGEVELAVAYGMANRAWGIPNTIDTRFALASGSKAFTALAVVSLIEDGVLTLGTTARSVLGSDLPLIDERVTVGHLLAHRSGIGDYLDEDDGHELSDYVMTVPVHELDTTESFLAVLDGFPTAFAPDERFTYCNGGFVVLALIAERAGGVPFHDLVQERVCDPAGMVDTSYLRSDELPGGTALGYLSEDPSSRTNVFHLPVRGNGDGGIYSTAADVSRFWTALFDGRIVSPAWVAVMVRPRSTLPSGSARYGLGFWLDATGPGVQLEGCDAGVSFRSVHDPDTGRTTTVISNTTDGAWPILRYLEGQRPI